MFKIFSHQGNDNQACIDRASISPQSKWLALGIQKTINASKDVKEKFPLDTFGQNRTNTVPVETNMAIPPKTEKSGIGPGIQLSSLNLAPAW